MPATTWCTSPGRTEDLSGLINALRDGGCAGRELTVLGGDEVSRSRFGTGRTDVLLPRSMTVYYTTHTYLPNLVAGGRDADNPFFVLARNELGIGLAERSALVGAVPTAVCGQLAGGTPAPGLPSCQ
ncbi:hypothetical protein [Actinoallomurus sp. NPDC050550]|uniref:hypothetical protein n=1 Tax=Actinoallomurus sp. NPDC050550 TaxID=3154937 RepID=UPI0033E31D91